MKFGAEEIQDTAATLGFRPDSLEKVFRLLNLLETLRSNAFLRPRIALKGGTALNLFLFEVPRLSVDIDLNYIGSGDRDTTQCAEHPSIAAFIRAQGAEGEDAVVRYLESGKVMYFSPGIVRDALESGDGKTIIGDPSTLTDGTWSWPMYLGSIVKRYHLALPREFLSHIAGGPTR